MRSWYVLLLASIFVAFAIGIEVAYSFSVKQKGPAPHMLPARCMHHSHASP